MKTEFFYSKSTGLYVARKPLKIDSRIKKAAEKFNVEINWDDEGRINFIDFDNAKRLLTALGSVMMSPIEYWHVLADAKKTGDKEMVDELMSNRYCEWLDRVYLEKDEFIDNPKIIAKYKYAGKKQKSIFPFGRPGWFNPEHNIDYNLGVPKKIELSREKFATSWKYWSPDLSVTKLGALAPIRGYVTSVGKPSMDLGIPVDSKQPMQIVRECRTKPLEPPIKAEILNKARKILEDYNKIGNNLRIKENYKKIYKNSNIYTTFLIKYGNLFRSPKELAVYKLREQFFNLLGLLKIIALSKNQNTKKLDASTTTLSGVSAKKLSHPNFTKFILESRKRLKEALNIRKDIVFVMGHKNPDTDTVISSLFEAWRNHILDKGKINYVPIVQSHKIPDETRRLLGTEISNSILLCTEKIYDQAKKSGLARWICVDQNRELEVQKYFISIIDHHIVCETAKFQDVPKTLEMTGSCTALITQKILGMGLSINKKLAKILYGATLMDTENRIPHKMTPKDVLIMDYLKDISETANDSQFYSDLMSFLLNTDDPGILFRRDYKEDWGFGFAVAKIKRGFDKMGGTIKKELVRRAVNLAKINNVNKNLPLTVLRITDYEDDNEMVNRERVYLVFNEKSSKEFKNAIFDLLVKIVKFEFEGVKIRTTKEFVEFWGTGMQLSRKKTAPILEPVVKVFNEYFYSPSNNLWIKRDFLKNTSDTVKAAKNLGIKISTDKEKRLNFITYPEAKSLVKELSFSMLSLKEYWTILVDAKKIKDIQMIDSLQGSNFVEFLDTVIKDYAYAIEHPKIKKEGITYKFEGKKKKVIIPKGKPGLIHPNEINLKTGIPKKVRKPNEYGNPALWRYWEPDSKIVIPTRSYIFLLKQPCWDGKFHVTDSFPNLGIRPCCKKVRPPQVKAISNEKRLNIKIRKEGDIISYSWIKQ